MYPTVYFKTHFIPYLNQSLQFWENVLFSCFTKKVNWGMYNPSGGLLLPNFKIHGLSNILPWHSSPDIFRRSLGLLGNSNSEIEIFWKKVRVREIKCWGMNQDPERTSLGQSVLWRDAILDQFGSPVLSQTTKWRPSMHFFKKTNQIPQQLNGWPVPTTLCFPHTPH